MARAKPDLSEQVGAHKDAAAELTAAGRLDDAIAEYRAALDLAPADVFARQRTAELLAHQGQPARAIEHYLCLVGKYAVEGRLLKAIATCHIVLQLDPSHADTLTTLTDLYAARDVATAPVRVPSIMARAGEHSSQPSLFVDPATLGRIPLFSELAREPFEAILRKFERIVVRAGEVVVEEGRPGDALFAIAQGVVRVERREPSDRRVLTTSRRSSDRPDAPRVIAELTEGEFFGEMSLISNCPRFASVVALTECEILRLGRQDLEETVAQHPRVGEVIRGFYKQRMIANIARASPIFGKLPPENQSALVDLFRIEVHPARKMLIRQGTLPDHAGDGLFILLRGKCDVFHRRADGVDEPLPAMGEGDLCGEVSLLQGGPPTACVRTASPCVVLGLHREWVDELILAHAPVRDVIYELASQRLERTQEKLARESLGEGLV